MDNYKKLSDELKNTGFEINDNLKRFEKEKDIQTRWQKQLITEPDFNKRKEIVFAFLDSIGVDTTNWKERKEL